MHLNTAIEAEAAFAKWQLKVDHGQHIDKACNISLSDYFMCAENTIELPIDSIYPNIHILNLHDQYFSEHIILSTLNQ
jgi:hypothetical protein